MSKTEEIRIECMTEILETIGITATEEQIKTLVRDFCLHVEMESEMSSYQHVGHKEECSKCKKLESDLRLAKEDIETYKSSVKSRRNCSEVWTENGSVLFR